MIKLIHWVNSSNGIANIIKLFKCNAVERRAICGHYIVVLAPVQRNYAFPSIIGDKTADVLFLVGKKFVRIYDFFVIWSAELHDLHVAFPKDGVALRVLVLCAFNWHFFS